MNRLVPCFATESLAAVIAAILSIGSVYGQSPTARYPIPTFHDELLDHLVGKWDMTGTAHEKPVHFTFDVEWVLNHQFLRIYKKGKEIPPWSNAPFESLIFIGYDQPSKRYYVHDMDTTGHPRLAAYADRNGNEIKFAFDISDQNISGRIMPGAQEVHRLIWQPESRTWHITWGAGEVVDVMSTPAK